MISLDLNADSFKGTTKFYQIDFNNFNQMMNFAEKYSSYFDVVISTEVIEHIENIGLYFDTLYKVLKKEGHVIISTPNISSFISRIYFFRKGIPMQFDIHDLLDYGHINPMSILEIEYLLKKRKFEILSTQEGGTLPYFWLRRNLKGSIIHFFALLSYKFMKGYIKSGWCVIITAKKKD